MHPFVVFALSFLVLATTHGRRLQGNNEIKFESENQSVSRESRIDVRAAGFVSHETEAFRSPSAGRNLLGDLPEKVKVAPALAYIKHATPAQKRPLGRRQYISPPIMMGRKFESNKDKMAKTALAYAKKASYIGKKVFMAVRAGKSDDPKTNLELAKILAEATALQVPKDVVTKNMKRALDSDTSNYDELTYEAYGHGGVGFIINCLSDNKNRAIGDVSTAIKKEECKVAAPGSVAFSFQRKGRLTVTEELDEDKLIEMAIEAGCDGDVSLEKPDPDGRNDGEEVKCVVLTEPTELGMLQSALQGAGYGVTSMLINTPMNTVEVSEEDENLNFKLIDRLEKIDDVDSVEHNMALSA
jgi:YebC/PmpR family DNA-binding regulatory protein